MYNYITYLLYFQTSNIHLPAVNILKKMNVNKFLDQVHSSNESKDQ